MSMTYWLMNEHGTALYEEDLHGLYYFQLNLDALCEKLGITPLSEYVDDSELRAQWLDDEDNLPEDADIERDALREPAAWHDPAALLAVLQALEQQLQQDPDSLYQAADDDDDDDDDFADDDEDGCHCDDGCGCCAGDEDEDDEDSIELTPELVLEDIHALKPLLQGATARDEKVHLRLLG